MTILTIYTTFVEKGIFLKAIQTDPTGVDNEKVHSFSLFIYLLFILFSYLSIDCISQKCVYYSKV
jgi:hypothetical protein